MKKMFALVLAAMLCLCTSAMAEGFTFTTTEFVEAFNFMGNAALDWQVNWTGFDVIEELPSKEVAFATGEGFTEVQVVGLVNGGNCTALGTSAIVDMNSSDFYEVGKQMGATMTAIPLSVYYLEVNGDTNALVAAIPEFEQSITDLMQKGASEQALQAAIDEGSHTEYGTIGGHPAQFTIIVGGDELCLEFILLP